MGPDARANAKRAMQELFGGRVEELNESEELVEESFRAVEEEPAEERHGAWAAADTQPKGVCTTVIGGDTVITGTIKSSGNVEVRGTVYGDIDCAKDVLFYGRIAGNIACKNFYQYAGAVKGNVNTANAVYVERESAIKGDIKAKDIQMNGRLIGNLSSTNSIDLLGSAIIVGDIETRSFNMKETAKLRGAVKLLCDNKDIDDAFKDCFDF